MRVKSGDIQVEMPLKLSWRTRQKPQAAETRCSGHPNASQIEGTTSALLC
jgi:hypothetical protein